MKRCSKCKKKQVLCCFSPDSKAKDRRKYMCKSYHNEAARIRRARDKASMPHYVQKTMLKKKYGITLEEYDHMVEKQHGVCAICASPETAVGVHGHVQRLAVDHDHKTGVIRGLLCANCNQGLGRFIDNPAILAAAIRYLLEGTA